MWLQVGLHLLYFTFNLIWWVSKPNSCITVNQILFLACGGGVWLHETTLVHIIYMAIYFVHVPLADDKPDLGDLLHMSYTGEDGKDVHCRLMDQVKPNWRRLAIALKFLQHEIATMENKDDPVYYLLTEWLRGANKEKDPRPVTWGTFITALRDANIQEEATVLESHFIQIPKATSGELMVYVHVESLVVHAGFTYRFASYVSNVQYQSVHCQIKSNK